MNEATLSGLMESCEDIVEFDRLVFPNSHPLTPFQQHILRKAAQCPNLFIEACRAAGKSYLVARIGLLKMVLARRKIIHTGPSYRQAKHPQHYMEDLVEQSPFLLEDLAEPPREGSDRTQITLRNRSAGVALPASGPKIHGERGTDVVFTEFFDYDRDLYLRSVKPMLAVRVAVGPVSPLAARLMPVLAKGHSVIWETTAGYTFHFSHEVREDVLARIAAGDSDYGFVSVTAADIREMNEGLPEDRRFPMEWRIVESDRAFDEDIYQQQYMNRWLSITGAFYELANLMRSDLRTGDLLSEAREGKTYTAGFDAAPPAFKGKPGTSALVVVEIDRSPSVPPAVVYAEVWTDGPRTDDLAQRVAKLLRRFRVSLLCMDIRGGGVNVFEKLRLEHGFAERDDQESPGQKIVMAYPGTASVQQQSHYALKDHFRDGFLILPRSPEDEGLAQAYRVVLLALKQLADLRVKRTNMGFLHFEAPSGRRKDAADALLYAHYAARLLMEPVWERARRERFIIGPLKVPPLGGSDPLLSALEDL